MIFIAIFFSGCANKISIKEVKAGQIGDNSVRNIAIAKFKKDYVAQSYQIESILSRIKFDGKRYFNILDRKNLNMIMKEQKLNDSGLVDIQNSTENGLTSVQSILTGIVDYSTVTSNRYKVKRTNYDRCLEYEKGKKSKQYCVKFATYKVACKSYNYSVQTNIRLVKVDSSKILFSKTYNRSAKKYHCHSER